jgi:ABC-type antimicrobial peptide transport system permease subunit
VAGVDREAVVFDVDSLSTVVGHSLQRQRFALVLVGTLAVLALVMAAAGLYGVMAFEVNARQAEIGVRVALGARPGSIRRQVVSAGLARGGVGLALGVAAALAAGRWLTLLVPELAEPTTPSLIWVLAVVLAVVVLASDPAARRAARVDPVSSLTRA